MYRNLKAELARNEINQKKLAEILNLPESGISERLNGSISWKKEEIDKVLEATKGTYEYIFLSSSS